MRIEGIDMRGMMIGMNEEESKYVPIEDLSLCAQKPPMDIGQYVAQLSLRVGNIEKHIEAERAKAELANERLLRTLGIVELERKAIKGTL